MKHFLIILSFIPILTFGQSNEKVIVGKIIAENSQKAIPFVFVRNISNINIASGNFEGFFKIKGTLGDTIEFVHISTLNKRIIIKNTSDTLIVILKDDIQELDEIVVLPTYKRFKKNFLALKEKKEEAKIHIPGIKIMTKPGIPPAITIGNPLSFIASKFSKKEKEKKEHRILIKEEGLQKRYNEKLSPQLVQEITKLKGEKLIEFMSYCKLNRDFVLKATQYELIVAIKTCFNEFES